MNQRLHGVYRDRRAGDIDEALHAQQIRAAQRCERVEPHRQPGCRYRLVVINAKSADVVIMAVDVRRAVDDGDHGRTKHGREQIRHPGR